MRSATRASGLPARSPVSPATGPGRPTPAWRSSPGASCTVTSRAMEPSSPREYVGLVTRSIAFALDAAVINLIAVAVGAVVALAFSLFPVSHTMRNVLLVVGGVAYFCWLVAYFVSFWSTTGETPGAHAMRIRVIRTDGSR